MLYTHSMYLWQEKVNQLTDIALVRMKYIIQCRVERVCEALGRWRQQKLIGVRSL